MNVSSLSKDETLALVGLLREIVQADDDYSESERAGVRALRDAIGGDRFDAAVLAARDRFTSRALLKEHAKTIVRPEARKLIHDELRKVAESDGVTESEAEPLRWLASWWDLR